MENSEYWPEGVFQLTWTSSTRDRRRPFAQFVQPGFDGGAISLDVAFYITARDVPHQPLRSRASAVS